MSDNDDEQVGRLLTRRQMLALMAEAGGAFLLDCTTRAASTVIPTSTSTSQSQSPTSTSASQSTPTSGATATSTTGSQQTIVPSCVVVPEQTEGPYFVDEMLERSDIRSDPETDFVVDGTPLALTMNVAQLSSNSCTSLSGAMVDIWHCDALGEYSDVNDNSQGFSNSGEKWLRGFQVTDNSGQVKFTTIYPGWYQGRATHIHFKVRKDDQEFTSQLYFDDDLSDIFHTQGAYASKGSNGRTQNSTDGIYRNGGDLLTLDVVEDGEGYAAAFDIGMQV